VDSRVQCSVCVCCAGGTWPYVHVLPARQTHTEHTAHANPRYAATPLDYIMFMVYK
jgi:hypothetical protein